MSKESFPSTSGGEALVLEETAPGVLEVTAVDAYDWCCTATLHYDQVAEVVAYLLHWLENTYE